VDSKHEAANSGYARVDGTQDSVHVHWSEWLSDGLLGLADWCSWYFWHRAAPAAGFEARADEQLL